MITLDGIKVFPGKNRFRALGERPVQSSPVWKAMAPKRKRSASEQPGWPKAAEAAAAAARAAAVAAGQPSYTFTWSEGGSQKTKEMWPPSLSNGHSGQGIVSKYVIYLWSTDVQKM